MEVGISNMAWIYLVLAGLLEIGWPLGLKLSQATNHKIGGIILAAVCMIGSGGLLWLAQKDIPIGTAYAIWTGVGAAGTFLVGIVLFGDSTNALRIASALLIVAGLAGLKLTYTP
jgi:quaternary ammonium compound-resistance protein SugE